MAKEDQTTEWHESVADALMELSEGDVLSRKYSRLLMNGNLSIYIMLKRQETYLAALRALRDAIMDGLCNGGTPAYDKEAPARLDAAIVEADRLLTRPFGG